MDLTGLAISSPNNKFIVGLWFRVCCASVFLVFVAGIDSGGVVETPIVRPLIYGSLGCLVLVNGLYWQAGKMAGFDLRQFYIHWGIDLVLIVGILAALGNWSEPVAMSAFTLIIVTSATFISRFASTVVASGASMALLAWCSIMAVTANVSHGAAAWTNARVLFVAGSGAVFFFMIAFLAGTLAEALKTSNQLLERRNLELASGNETLLELQGEIEFQTRVVAHDIRAPVSAAAAAILLASQLIKSSRAPADIDEGIEVLRGASDSLARADRMIERLRELQEVEGAAFQEAEIKAGDLLGELGEEWRSTLLERKSELRVNCGHAVIRGDRALLEVLFRNLVGNALRYVPGDGSGIVEISLSRLTDVPVFTVADNGPGIPDVAYVDIFRLFRKVPGDGVSKGLGMGLALVRRVIERHGGRVWAGRSELGGAAILFQLPRSRVTVFDEAKPL